MALTNRSLRLAEVVIRERTDADRLTQQTNAPKGEVKKKDGVLEKEEDS